MEDGAPGVHLGRAVRLVGLVEGFAIDSAQILNLQMEESRALVARQIQKFVMHIRAQAS